MTSVTKTGVRTGPVARVAAVALLVPVLALASTPPADAAPKRCTRGHAAFVAADGDVAVVKVKARRGRSQSRREKLLACWRPTGRRFQIAEETDSGEDSVTQSDVTVVGGRYVGLVQTFIGGISESARAAVFDARSRRRLHASDRCDFDRFDFSGVDDAVFTPKGGMAYACERLFFFPGPGRELEMLEPEGADVRHLAVSDGSQAYGARLFWTVAAGASLITKSKEL